MNDKYSTWIRNTSVVTCDGPVEDEILMLQTSVFLGSFFPKLFPINKFGAQNANSGHGIVASLSTEKDVPLTCCFQVPPEAAKHCNLQLFVKC